MRVPLRTKLKYWRFKYPWVEKVYRSIEWLLQPLMALRDFAVTLLVRGAVALLRVLGPDRSSNIAGSIARRLGPLIPNSKIARTNLAASFPDKSAEEIEEIIRGVWENLGRVAGEFVDQF
ncbi:MAG TPA: hypothetical protein PL193_01560, partial [Xanthobacteraceae bacterium]|nr:hypothetical protein [Xanthobacteraceae bacterium]